MSVKNSLTNLVKVLGGTPTKKTVRGLLGDVALAVGGKDDGKSVRAQIDNIVAAKNPLSALTVDVTIDADEDLLGKKVAQLQNNIAIANGEITGELYYVTGYTGFWPSRPDMQEGNYIALHASVPEVSGCTIKCKLTDWVTLDADGIVVLRIRDKDTQTITFCAEKEGGVPVYLTLGLSGLTCDKPPTEALVGSAVVGTDTVG